MRTMTVVTIVNTPPNETKRKVFEFPCDQYETNIYHRLDLIKLTQVNQCTPELTPICTSRLM